MIIVLPITHCLMKSDLLHHPTLKHLFFFVFIYLFILIYYNFFYLAFIVSCVLIKYL